MHTISLAEAADLIAAVGHRNRFLLRGEKGIGKSSIMPMLEERLGTDEYHFVYMDVGAMVDSGDIAMPFPDRERGVTQFLLREKLQARGKKLVIMFDEMTKATAMVMAAIHPSLEPRKPRIADEFMPDGSIAFGGGNLDEEGVGDQLADHTRDRVTEVIVRKYKQPEWDVWAGSNNIHPAVRAWCKETPQVFASFMDPDFDGDRNQMVYDPRKVQKNFVTLRGLELMSNLLWDRDKYSDNALRAALAGTGGEYAADSLSTFIRFFEELPSRESIMSSPETARVPEASGVLLTLIFTLVAAVSKETITPIMKYVSRFPVEPQSQFNLTVYRNPKTRDLITANAHFTKWALDNQDLL